MASGAFDQEPVVNDPYMIVEAIDPHVVAEPARASRKRKRYARSPIVERAPRKRRSDAGVPGGRGNFKTAMHEGRPTWGP